MRLTTTPPDPLVDGAGTPLDSMQQLSERFLRLGKLQHPQLHSNLGGTFQFGASLLQDPGVPFARPPGVDPAQGLDDSAFDSPRRDKVGLKDHGQVVNSGDAGQSTDRHVKAVATVPRQNAGGAKQAHLLKQQVHIVDRPQGELPVTVISAWNATGHRPVQERPQLCLKDGALAG